jgi:hypothetical protein
MSSGARKGRDILDLRLRSECRLEGGDSANIVGLEEGFEEEPIDEVDSRAVCPSCFDGTFAL